ncbi:MAG TPA: zinc-dependent alcohol dehydrogenase family protein [Thermomicrobiales bacterium]|nr:zinc-dependent alcohol dehydrogenase family protein [Thermomicrobiales bacterium]
MQTTGVIWDRESGIGFATRTLPDPQPGELLLEVGASGLCGTDLHIAAGEYPLAKSGVVLGHEYAGTVIEVGPGTPVFSVGDRVVVDPNIPCRMCTACREARPHLCANPQTLGVTIDGGLGTHSIVPADRAYRLPDSLPMAAAALTEPLACVVHAVDRAGLEPGHSALVIGAGPIGLLTASLLKAAGASSVCVSEPNERRRALAPAFGGIPIEPHDVPTNEFDVVMECVGLPATLAAAIPAVRPGGTVVWVGVAAPQATVPVNPYDIFRREITIRGTYTNPHTMDRSIALLDSGQIPWRETITHSLALDRFDEAWEAHRTGAGLKVCVLPNGDL